jgi:uncharacterized protein (TIRG00374 family)
MADHENPLKSPQKRLWRSLLTLIILGLAVHLLVPQITTLTSSWSVVQGMIWWAVALAVLSQALSYLGSGFMLHAILEPYHEKLSTLKGVLITMAAFSVGLVAGGWVGSAAATYGWVRRENRDGNTATLAGTLPPLVNDAILVSVALIGTIYLLVVHDLSNTQLIEFSIVLLVLGLLVAGGVVALNTPEKATRFAVWLASQWATLRRKPFTPNNTIASVRQFIAAWDFLRKGNWWILLLGAIANIGFDMLTLYFMFIAAGYSVSFGVLFAGYGLPFMLAKVAFIFPGGVGVVEGSMVALYNSLKVPNAVSVVVILGYRLFSFWLPTLLGCAAATYLSGKLSSTKGEQA